MSITLGEKLRQAREDRGISISEVAEQTRISALYLESIENNDYKPLPGGIFNKGFVKSYAKFVGIDEQEALQDYAALIAEQGEDINDAPKTFRSEVLTDESNRSSLLPTLLFSIIILGLMVWGIMAFLNYYSSDSSPSVTDANTNKNANVAQTPTQTPTPSITIDKAKVQLKTTNPVWFTVEVDGKKELSDFIRPEKPQTYEPKEVIIIKYPKGLGDKVQMSVNDKSIALPAEPENAEQNDIVIELKSDNISQVFQTGKIR